MTTSGEVTTQQGLSSVGDHLAGVSMSADEQFKVDLFGRSAYNRYYYSAFLCARSLLKAIDPKWATPTHSDLPSILARNVLDRLRKHIAQATKTRQITEGDGQQMLHRAAVSAKELSRLLITAREIRRIADYEPETLVSRDGSQIRLGGHTIDGARKWRQRAGEQARAIVRVYEQLGII
jgi:uncharacterized protein (UPF0332 family)